MLGAIIGDLCGSIYEYEQFSKVKDVKIKNIIENNAFFSDDTILTVAIANAILDDRDYKKYLQNYARQYENYKPDFSPYFEGTFSPNFTRWANSNTIGTSEGNGAMMRISPVGLYFNTEDEIIKNVVLATSPSHNSEKAIECAKIVALIIFYAKSGLKKEEIIKKLGLKIQKPNITKFNYTCSDTIDLCLYSLFNATSFEDSLRIAVSFGGDTDTNACIVGSMAESLFGIPEYLVKEAKEKLPTEFIEIIDKFYEKIAKN